MKDALVRLLSSMKVWTAVLGLITFIGAKYGFNVDSDTYWAIIGVFGILLGTQGLQDHGKEAAKAAATAPVTPTTLVDNSMSITNASKEEVK